MDVLLKPLAVFRLGSLKVMTCQVVHGRPDDALDRELLFRDGDLSVPVRLLGISTAWIGGGVYDFRYEGDLEPPIEPSARATLTDAE